MTGNALAVHASGLRRRFGGIDAVDGLDLTVEQGTVHALLGPNGAGKTTTVRMLATLLRPTAGSATVLGHDVVREAAVVRGLIGLTGQYAALDEPLTARENLLVLARLRGLGRRESRGRADELLETMGLQRDADRGVATFSGGMRRRLDIAASLVVRPRLLFLDEPTTGLDPRTRSWVWDVVRDLVSSGGTVLLTTQYLEEADLLADRVTVVDHGRVVAEGAPSELKAAVGGLEVEVSTATPAEADRAAAVVRASGRSLRRPGPTRLVVGVGDVDDGLGLLKALRGSGVELREAGVRPPTLDEVFLRLTSAPQRDVELRGVASR